MILLFCLCCILVCFVVFVLLFVVLSVCLVGVSDVVVMCILMLSDLGLCVEVIIVVDFGMFKFLVLKKCVMVGMVVEVLKVVGIVIEGMVDYGD